MSASPANISLSQAGELVSALGTPQFAQQLWRWLRRYVDPYSHHTVATRYRRPARRPVDNVDLLFFAGDTDPEMSRRAIRLYLDSEWRTDSILPYVEHATDPQLVLMSNDQAPATEYGHYMVAGELGEDCTLLGRDRDYVYAFTTFRRRGQPPFTLAEVGLLRQLCDFLLPLLVQHTRLAGVARLNNGETLGRRFERRLAEAAVQLSARETAICHALLQGQTPAAIAQQLALQPCSVRTYQQRALAKIGVSSRAELFAWCLAAAADLH
ncbi:helix-turn-helix transcriptional regulator [Neisseriaceae bacterium JH1-16]|nr:helix-turn-helix transcriptional regulator [Neisseriaceae bacterium JH1-16]